MKKMLASRPRILFGVLAVLICMAGNSLGQDVANSTNAGSPAVYSNASSPTIVYSNAYVDASASGIAGDVCAKLTTALGQIAGYSAGTAVIDARGIASTALACSSTDQNPWNGITTPSEVLLPAGVIQIYNGWTLPAGTKLIGEGGEDPGSSDATVGRTIIQAEGSFSGYILQMGTSSTCGSGLVYGVSIEDLVVDGNSISGIDGINNSYCGDLSYVDHVTLYRIGGTGLNVGASATNSGPYTNITFDTTVSGGSGTTGAILQATTRGIQGMTCTTGTATLTGNNVGTCINIATGANGNAIEDVRVEGFSVGVNVGASNTVLMNIDGDTNPHNSSTTLTVISLSSTVTDVAAIAVTNNCASSCTDNNDFTISDSATSTNLKAKTDPFIAAYVLGDSPSSGIYSRYTTSPTVASWSVGNGPAPTTSCAPGSLFSNTSGSPYALYVCSAVPTTGAWKAISLTAAP
jgi:hypothetical protein